MHTNEYLDAAKAKSGIESDYALARQFEVRKEEISQVRRGIKPLTPYLAARVSDVTGIPLEKIIEDIEAQDKNEARARYWKERAARKAAGFFLSVICAGFVSMPMESRANVAETLEVTDHPETLIGSGSQSDNNAFYLLCAIARRMLSAFVTRIDGLVRSSSAIGLGKFAFQGP